MIRPILLLDVMGTLVSEPFEEDIPKFFGMTLSEFYKVKHPDAWIEFEHGRMDEEAYCRSFFQDGRPVDREGLKACLVQSYGWLEGVEPLLGALKAAGYSMYALSNYSSWYQLIEAKLGLSRYLEWRFVSCETGVRKPDAEAYLGPARALGVSPSDCLFVDDREKNVDAAKAVGMKAVLRPPSIASFREALLNVPLPIKWSP